MPESLDDTIVCVDCGGTARLMRTWPSDDPPQEGDIVTYQCPDCGERLDIVLDVEDDLRGDAIPDA